MRNVCWWPPCCCLVLPSGAESGSARSSKVKVGFGQICVVKGTGGEMEKGKKLDRFWLGW